MAGEKDKGGALIVSDQTESASARSKESPKKHMTGINQHVRIVRAGWRLDKSMSG
jgi:hypothetical protein